MKKNVLLIRQWIRSAFVLHNAVAWIFLLLSIALTVMAWKSGSESMAVLVLGLAFALLLFFILVSLLNNRQKLQMKNALIESKQARLESLLESSTDGIHILDQNGDLIIYSDSFIQMLGYTAEEALRLNVRDWDAYFTESQIIETLEYIILNPHQFETRHRRQDGSVFDVEISSRPIQLDGQSYIYCSARDITEREKILKNLQQTTSLLEEAQRLAGIGSWVYEYESGKNEWSKESYSILGLNLECTPTLETFLTLVHPKERKKLRHAYNKSVRDHKAFDSVVEIILGQKISKYIQVRGEHYYNEENRLLQSRGTFHDVTEMVKSRQIIENDRERFRAIADMGSDWYWESNPAGLLVHLSENVSKTLGYETAELLGKRLIDFASVSMPEPSIASFNECFKKRQRLESFIIDIDTKEGETLVFELNAEPVFTSTRKFNGYRGIARDITLQHRLQKLMIEQNNELRTIFETSKDGIVITDFKGNFLDFNQAFMDMIGYSRGELMSMGYQDVTPRHQIEDIYEHALKLLEGEPFVNIIKTTVDKYGKPHTLNMTITLMPDHQRLLSTIKDITEQKLRADELSATYDRLKMATEAANIGIWIWNIQDNSLKWDEKMFHIYHIPPEKREKGMSYVDWISRVHPDDVAQTEQALHAALNGGTPYNVTFRIVFDNGIVKYIQATAIINLDTSGNPATMIGINRDVTNDKTVEQALIRAKTAAEEANRSKSNFIANMSHEIRTPLNGLIGLTELTLKTPLTPLQFNYLKKADQSAKALMNVINDILDYSKIEAGKFTLDLQPFNLKELLQVVYDLFEYKAIEKNLEFDIDLYSDVPNILKGDSVRLTQVLINLVGNAIKFTEHGSVRIKISHHLIDGYHELLFQIVDTGIGISSENLATLFEPFSQADSSFSRKYGGTGLGLVISKELIHLMDGELNTTSIPGKGSTFAFSVRLQEANETEIISPNGQRTNTTEFIRAAHILLVEDNDINQIVASEKLKAYGLDITIANNGQEAVEMVKSNHYDLIFMDLQMPVMDGFEASRQIRHLANGDSIPIIALSAAAMKQDCELALQAGMNDHLSKPIINANLEKILQHYLSSSVNIPSGSPQSRQTSHSIKSLSFNLEALQNSIMGNHDLIFNLLSRFLEQYSDYTTILTDKADESKNLSAYLHTLKGISGNLQMSRLQDLCRRYEQNKDHRVIDDIKEELENVLSAVREFLKDHS